MVFGRKIDLVNVHAYLQGMSNNFQYIIQHFPIVLVFFFYKISFSKPKSLKILKNCLYEN